MLYKKESKPTKEPIFNNSPLPFQGQKRYFVTPFRDALKELSRKHKINVIVDLFGGSGLLSHNAKKICPQSRVIYNDYDNFSRRLDNIEKTNALLHSFREIVKGYPDEKRLTPELQTQIIKRIEEEEKQTPYPDYITLSASLLFSGNFATTGEELKKQSFYNVVRKTPYTFNPEEYLEGLEIVREDYNQLFNRFKNVPGVLFLADPPYLATDTKSYTLCQYWKLKDYLNVLSILSNENYFFFTSDKSNLIELCAWMEEKHGIKNPFKNAKTAVKNNRVGKEKGYQDIMVYKFIA